MGNVASWQRDRPLRAGRSSHKRLLIFSINLRVAMSPPILYLVTTRSSAMVCSCSSSDMLAVKFPSLLGPTKRQLSADQLGSDRYAAARCKSASLRMPRKLLPLYGVTKPQPSPPKPREWYGKLTYHIAVLQSCSQVTSYLPLIIL